MKLKLYALVILDLIKDYLNKIILASLCIWYVTWRFEGDIQDLWIGLFLVIIFGHKKIRQLHKRLSNTVWIGLLYFILFFVVWFGIVWLILPILQAAVDAGDYIWCEVFRCY